MSGFNNGFPFEITPATPFEQDLTNSFDPSSITANMPGSGGLFGIGADKWASGLKDIAGGLKGAATTPSSAAQPRSAQPQAADLVRGQGGTLGPLLQLLAARANAYWQAAHQGAVPAPQRNTGGLLGL